MDLQNRKELRYLKSSNEVQRAGSARAGDNGQGSSAAVALRAPISTAVSGSTSDEQEHQQK